LNLGEIWQIESMLAGEMEERKSQDQLCRTWMLRLLKGWFKRPQKPKNYGNFYNLIIRKRNPDGYRIFFQFVACRFAVLI